MPTKPHSYEYFTPPTADDIWSPKISGWQRRERAEEFALEVSPPPVSERAPAQAAPTELLPLEAVDSAARTELPQASELDSEVPVVEVAEDRDENLRAKYSAFRISQKRAMARSVAEWTQAQALDHYVEDGPLDHWATLEETLRNNGDDCDGLELLSFHALRELGFEPGEVFRAIVYRSSDGQHHMVTLWFEDPEDPWVIDPTGAMTLGMPRMSELPGWVPVKLFSDTQEYTVSEGVPAAPITVIADSR
ncbi:MAG: hypothetical protein OSB70_07075 [Myxococcota bacterium]|nr:hypothetical protein [Myxococcota bacterium]